MRRDGAPAKPSVIHVQVDRDRVPVVRPASATSSAVPHLRFTRHVAFRPLGRECARSEHMRIPGTYIARRHNYDPLAGVVKVVRKS